MQGRYVAHPDERLGMCRDQLEVEQRDQLPASVAAAYLHDDVDLGIAERLVQVLGARLRGPGQVAPLPAEVLALHHRKAGRPDHREGSPRLRRIEDGRGG